MTLLYPMHFPMEEVCGFHKSLYHSTPPSGKHLPLSSIGHANAGCFKYFIMKKATRKRMATNNNMGMAYQTNEKHLTLTTSPLGLVYYLLPGAAPFLVLGTPFRPPNYFHGKYFEK